MNSGAPLTTGRSRGQTAQDFAVGIGLFLIAVAFVFAFIPTVLSPFEAGVGSSEYAQADRAGTIIVGNASADDRPGELDSTAFEAHWNDSSSDHLRDETGLPFSARINVTVENVDDDGTDPGWTAGSDYQEGRSAATSTRIVRTTEAGQCEPACKLVVRVW